MELMRSNRGWLIICCRMGAMADWSLWIDACMFYFSRRKSKILALSKILSKLYGMGLVGLWENDDVRNDVLFVKSGIFLHRFFNDLFILRPSPAGGITFIPSPDVFCPFAVQNGVFFITQLFHLPINYEWIAGCLSKWVIGPLKASPIPAKNKKTSEVFNTSEV